MAKNNKYIRCPRQLTDIDFEGRQPDCAQAYITVNKCVCVYAWVSMCLFTIVKPAIHKRKSVKPPTHVRTQTRTV